MKEVLFSEITDSQKFLRGKSTCVKGRFMRSEGAWYGKTLNNWKAFEPNQKVKVES